MHSCKTWSNCARFQQGRGAGVGGTGGAGGGSVDDGGTQGTRRCTLARHGQTALFCNQGRGAGVGGTEGWQRNWGRCVGHLRVVAKPWSKAVAAEWVASNRATLRVGREGGRGRRVSVKQETSGRRCMIELVQGFGEWMLVKRCVWGCAGRLLRGLHDPVPFV